MILCLGFRGNTGGDTCLVYDLAYLLSNQINSPEDAKSRLRMHVRPSQMLDDLVYGESIATGTHVPGGGGGGGFNSLDQVVAELNQLDDVCTVAVAPDDIKGLEGGGESFPCASGTSDTQFYSCGDAPACQGRNAWLRVT